MNVYEQLVVSAYVIKDSNDHRFSMVTEGGMVYILDHEQKCVVEDINFTIE